MGKLDELTKDLYLKYKRRELTDKQIAAMFDTHGPMIYKWKKEHGLDDVNLQRWDTWDKYFPEEIAKLKRDFLEMRKKNWKQEAIAAEFGWSKRKLLDFMNRYFPGMVKRMEFSFTKQEIEIMNKNGISYNRAYHRVNRTGMTKEEAITKPINTGWKGDPAKRMAGKSLASEINAKPCTVLEDIFTPEQIKRAKKKGLSRENLRRRIAAGWSKQRALTQPKQAGGRKKNERK